MKKRGKLVEVTQCPMRWKDTQNNMESWKPSEYIVSGKREYLTVSNAPDITR